MPLKKKGRSGDLLLVIGDWRLIQAMRDRRKDFLVLNYPKEMERAVPAQRQAPLALLSILTMVVLMVSGVVTECCGGFNWLFNVGLFPLCRCQKCL